MCTDQSVSKGGGDMPIQPSATSRAIACPFGPKAEIRMGTSIGRGFASSGRWIIWQGSPSISTTSPASRLFTCSIQVRVVFQLSAP